MKYLNNIVEQDHRFIKKITKPGLGFQSIRTASKTIAGIEYICSAYLGPDHYFVVDRAINLETGAILWGLDEGDCFEFLRVEQESTSLPSS